MSIADAFIRAGQFKRVLVIGVEMLSRIVDWTDRNTCVLFGDGAGAAVLVPPTVDDGNDGAASCRRTSTPTARGAQPPQHPGRRHRPSRRRAEDASRPSATSSRCRASAVFTHAVKNIWRAAVTALEAQRQDARATSTVVVAHQANLRILEGVAERVRHAARRSSILNIHKYGNTSSASIPIALDEAVREGSVKPGDLCSWRRSAPASRGARRW